MDPTLLSVAEVPIRTNSLISINSQFRAGLKYLQTSLLFKRPFENREGSRANMLVRALDADMWWKGINNGARKMA